MIARLQSLPIAMATAAIMIGAPAQAQPSPELQALREEVRRATETLGDLSKRLEALEQREAGAPTAGKSDLPTEPVAPVIAVGRAETPEQPAIQTAKKVDPCGIRSRGPDSPADATLSGTFDAPAAACGRTVAAVLLTASSASSGVAIRLSRATEGGEPDYDKGETLARSDVFSLTASAPLDKDGPTQIATLDGFASASKLTFGFTRFMLPLPTDTGLLPTYAALLNKAQTACRAQAAAETAASKPLSYKRRCDEDTPDLRDAFLTEVEGIRMERILAAQTVRRALAFGFEFSIGHDEFKYRDEATLAEAKTTRVPLGAKATLSTFPWPRTSLTGGVEYQRTFKAAKTQIFCPAGAVTPSFECFSGPFGEPKRTNKLLLSGEARRIFNFDKASFIPQLGIAPKLEYDAKSDDVAFNLPIYLAPADKGKLIAGVQAGYSIANSDPSKLGKEHEFKVGLFVGSAFTLP